MTLRGHLRKHYEDQHLSPEKSDELATLVRSAGRRRRLWIGAAAAIVALALFFWPRGPSVAEEIATNHRKAVAPSFLCGSFGDVNRELERLDFDVVEPQRLKDSGYSVTGARYCSLQGRTAAQLKLESPDGGTCTLYAVPDLKSVDEGETKVDGLRIRIWRERGVLFGLCEATGRDREALPSR